MSFEPQDLNQTDLLMYQTEDGQTKLEVRLEDETVWLNQSQMMNLFQTSKQNISLHIRNIFKEGELVEHAVVKESLTTAEDGKQYRTKYYNLDVIISVGYRVKSQRGTQFRMWATQRLREYIIKGFTMNDDLLKKAGGGNYFDELLARIRDIRSSEKVFWKKVLEIYATSVDYDPRIETTKLFFRKIQNKMHWAAHGHTAAEMIALRSDASKPNMGLTHFAGNQPKKSDVGVAKNYLSKDEIDSLNSIVSFYLEFAEMQAKRHKSMYMKDWIAKLDDFLRISEHEILTHRGKITSDEAIKKANAEFDKYKESRKHGPTTVELDLLSRIEADLTKEKKKG